MQFLALLVSGHSGDNFFPFTQKILLLQWFKYCRAWICFCCICLLKNCINFSLLYGFIDLEKEVEKKELLQQVIKKVQAAIIEREKILEDGVDNADIANLYCALGHWHLLNKEFTSGTYF